MSQKYQVDNLTSRFIKCLLWDTYIPTVDIWKPGKAIIKGLTYITQDKYIVVAQKDSSDGYIYTISNDSPLVVGKTYYIKDSSNNYNMLDSIAIQPVEYYERTGTITASNQEYFKIIQPYVFGEFYPGITSNFKSNSSLYDSNTHYMLGQYLRAQRDLFDLDLMPFYNCFDGTISDKIRVEKDINNKDVLNTNNNIDDGLITYIVPIKYNNEYTLYYNSDIPFLIKPVYYNGITLTPLSNISNNTEIQSTKVKSCSFRNPYIIPDIKRFGGHDVTETLNSKLIEDYLCLLIQVNKSNLSNIVVLEGNYKGVNINNITNVNKLPEVKYGASEDVLKLSQSELNSILKPYSSLLYKNNGTNYTFNDRLLEYLLLSPIINRDKVRDNILRVQQYLSNEKAVKEFGQKYPYTYKKDIWDSLMRLYIYNLVIKDSKNPLFLDINGFVDKDSEFIIDRGKENGGNLDV